MYEEFNPRKAGGKMAFSSILKEDICSNHKTWSVDLFSLFYCATAELLMQKKLRF